MDDQSCFYIDRLVDFGLGMGVANQMVGMMNQYLNDGEMANLIAQKRVNKDTLAWVPGMMGWKPIEEVPAILKIVALAPPPLPTQNTQTT